jgi:hypothetical protein
MPVYVTTAGDARLFVVEQGGLIKIAGGGTFLDLSGVVGHANSEAGPYSMAFHPKYPSKGLFEVHYTRPSDGASVVPTDQALTKTRSLSDVNASDLTAAWIWIIEIFGEPGDEVDELLAGQLREYAVLLSPPDGGYEGGHKANSSSRIRCRVRCRWRQRRSVNRGDQFHAGCATMKAFTYQKAAVSCVSQATHRCTACAMIARY